MAWPPEEKAVQQAVQVSHNKSFTFHKTSCLGPKKQDLIGQKSMYIHKGNHGTTLLIF